MNCSLAFMANLIHDFALLDSKRAVRILVGICLKNDFALLRKALISRKTRYSLSLFFNAAPGWITRKQESKVMHFLSQNHVHIKLTAEQSLVWDPSGTGVLEFRRIRR